MKSDMNDREKRLKQLNIWLDCIDRTVADGLLTRKELTDIVLHRHILAMKQVMRYAARNLA